MIPSEEAILTHLRRGALEYCVLALLAHEETYGLDLARTLTRDGALMGGEGTLYPLLARLRKAGLVETYWQESDSGPPRRYYGITPDGHVALATFKRAWGPFSAAVNSALLERH